MKKQSPSCKTDNSTQCRLLAAAAPPVRLQLPRYETTFVTLVGCGGTGSHIATGLGALKLATQGETVMHLTLIDPDRVELKNVGRQLFAASDIGKYKAEVLAQRLASAYNLVPNVETRGVDALDFAVCDPRAFHLVIGAVDNPAARAVIASAVKYRKGALWWLDCGNDDASGQVLIGNTADARSMRGAVQLGMTDKLPAPHVVYPNLIATPRAKKRAASCAVATAQGKQGLMVNRMSAAWALALADALLVRRDVQWFGLAFDLTFGNTRPYALDVPTLASVTKLSPKELES